MSTQYRVPVLENFSWQPPVISYTTVAQPVAPLKGQRYLVPASATGAAWTGQDHKIAWFDGTIWKFDAPAEGWRVWVSDQDVFYTYVPASGQYWIVQGEGDMLKSVYDANNDGKIDQAAGGTGIDSSALTGVVKITAGVWSANANLDDVPDGSSYKRLVTAAVWSGYANQLQDGTNTVTAAQAKEAYDRRGAYDADLQCILFNLNP